MSSDTNKRLRPFTPRTFGRYTLLAPLAAGGMGEVFLARLPAAQGIERLCVIKKILPTLASEGDFVRRFIDEAKLLVQLNHGSIAQMLDMGQSGEDLFIALEFVDGKDLRKILARARERGEKVPPALALHMAGRVLDALAYAHRRKGPNDEPLNLVHRDISPQNVLVSYEGEVKVIDFGLAKSSLQTGRTAPSVILGKFFYMSPEQAKQTGVDRRTDLYACGIVLWELLAGRNPFEGVPQFELIMRVANPSIPPLSQVVPDIPPAVEALVRKALSPDPKERFASAEEMRAKVMAASLELDAEAGPEKLAAWLHGLFAAEHAQERKQLAQLRDVRVAAEPEGALPMGRGADATRVDPASTPAASSMAAGQSGEFRPSQAPTPAPAMAAAPRPMLPPSRDQFAATMAAQSALDLPDLPRLPRPSTGSALPVVPSSSLGLPEASRQPPRKGERETMPGKDAGEWQGPEVSMPRVAAAKGSGVIVGGAAASAPVRPVAPPLKPLPPEDPPEYAGVGGPTQPFSAIAESDPLLTALTDIGGPSKTVPFQALGPGFESGEFGVGDADSQPRVPAAPPRELPSGRYGEATEVERPALVIPELEPSPPAMEVVPEPVAPRPASPSGRVPRVSSGNTGSIRAVAEESGRHRHPNRGRDSGSRPAPVTDPESAPLATSGPHARPATPPPSTTPPAPVAAAPREPDDVARVPARIPSRSVPPAAVEPPSTRRLVVMGLGVGLLLVVVLGVLLFKFGGVGG